MQPKRFDTTLKRIIITVDLLSDTEWWKITFQKKKEKNNNNLINQMQISSEAFFSSSSSSPTNWLNMPMLTLNFCTNTHIHTYTPSRKWRYIFAQVNRNSRSVNDTYIYIYIYFIMKIMYVYQIFFFINIPSVNSQRLLLQGLLDLCKRYECTFDFWNLSFHRICAKCCIWWVFCWFCNIIFDICRLDHW